MRFTSCVLLGAAFTFALSAPAPADFMYVSRDYLGDLGSGDETSRFYAEFSDPTDELLGIFGTDDQPLIIRSKGALRNTTGNLAGHPWEDIRFPGIEIWDSWFALGCTPFCYLHQITVSENLFGADDGVAVLHGCNLLATEGGWFNSIPDEDPVTGSSILIAQFTTPSFHWIEGVVRWRRSGETEWKDTDFVYVAFPDNIADVNHDHAVDFTDLLLVLGDFGSTNPCETDIVINGVVDIEDVLTVLNAWGWMP